MPTVRISPVYLGTFWQRFDQKQRITVPAKWQGAASQSEFFLAWPHESGCIRVYPAEILDELLLQGSTLDEANEDFVEAQQEFFGHATQLIPDQQHRITLDSSLVASFPLDSQIALLGEGRRFSIWNAQDLRERRSARPFLFNSALTTLESYRHEP